MGVTKELGREMTHRLFAGPALTHTKLPCPEWEHPEWTGIDQRDDQKSSTGGWHKALAVGSVSLWRRLLASHL